MRDEEAFNRRVAPAFRNVIDVRSGLVAGLVMGTLVWFVNASHGALPATIAALKQATYTFFFGGMVIRLCTRLAERSGVDWRVISTAVAVPSTITILATFFVHSLRGTPEPLISTIPVMLLTPPILVGWARKTRRNLQSASNSLHLNTPADAKRENGHRRGPALVTGASSGIGAAYARRLANDGYDLVLVARRRDRLEALAAELEPAHQIRCEVLPLDLASESGIAHLEKKIEQGAPLSMLIHSAGFNTPKSFVENSSQTVVDMVNLHVVAAARLARAALPGMIATGQPAAVVFISSLASFFTTTGYTPYSATKAFVNMLTRGLSVELRGTGVRAQAVCAGLTATEFLSTPEYQLFNPYSRVPQWVFMQPEDVVETSIRGLERGKPIVVAGLMNRVFVSAIQTPILGHALNAALNALSPTSPR